MLRGEAGVRDQTSDSELLALCVCLLDLCVVSGDFRWNMETFLY